MAEVVNSYGNTYCDCLDWDEDFKTCNLKGMNEFNTKLHTIGVTEQEQAEYYITSA